MTKGNTNSDIVYREAANRIHFLLKADEGTVKARLAVLRHGIGKVPGEEPALWGMLFD